MQCRTASVSPRVWRLRRLDARDARDAESREAIRSNRRRILIGVIHDVPRARTSAESCIARLRLSRRLCGVERVGSSKPAFYACTPILNVSRSNAARSARCSSAQRVDDFLRLVARSSGLCPLGEAWDLDAPVALHVPTVASMSR